MISVSEIRKTYDRHTSGANEVLHGLSFDLPDTGFVCILGTSGSGKTSLLNAIGGLDRFDSGTVNVDGTKLSARSSGAYERTRNSTFGYIFQNYYLLSGHSAAYNVYIGLHSLKLSRKEKLGRVMEALKKVGMERYYRKNVGEMSGGQQQRVAIARAIARSPKVIFADEPTGNLDRYNTVNICTLLKELSRESLIVMVTHEEGIANFFADRIIRLEDGRITSDETEWERRGLDTGNQNTFYAGEYTESRQNSENIALRLLTAPDAAPVKLTVVVEKDRIVIKSDDDRVVMSSAKNDPPFIEEGKKPRLEAEEPEIPAETAEAPAVKTVPDRTVESHSSRGLEFSLLAREALGSRSDKKLRNIGTVLFLILLSFMLCLTAADAITISRIDPEEYVISDSRELALQFDRGDKMEQLDWSLTAYTRQYLDWLGTLGEKFYYIPTVAGKLVYRDETVPQYGRAVMELTNYSFAPAEQLDPDTLILGRMPERYDEIVVDRWLLDKAVSQPGIVPNIIPDLSYMLGKQLNIDKKNFAPVIVGICDSGEPSVYIDPMGLFALGNSGDDIITYSEYVKITGDTSVPEPLQGQCYTLLDNTGASYLFSEGSSFSTKTHISFKISKALDTDVKGFGLTARVVVSDAEFEEIYLSSIADTKKSIIWCKDKAAMLAKMKSEKLPDEIDGMVNVLITDRFAESDTNYRAAVAGKVNARFIVTLALAVLSIVMLYLLQRSRISERMELIAVYRMLGLPKRNAVAVFVLESVFQTLICSLPVILLTWGGIRLLGISGISNALYLPLWGALLTFALILIIRILFAAIPAIRLMLEPPARLASKHDF